MSMRMRTAFFLASLGGLVLFALGVLAFADSYQRIARMTELQQATNAVTGTGRRLALHTHDLVLHREARHREQWYTLRDEMAHILASRRASLQPYRSEVTHIEHYLGILEQQLTDYLAYMALPRTQAEMGLRTGQLQLREAELQSALDGLEKAVRLSVEAELGTSGQGLVAKFALLFGLYVLAGGMAWWFFYLRMQQPLSALASGIHRIRDGDFRFRPDKVAPDEIGSVVEALNELLDRQQALTGKLARSETQLRATLDNTPNVAIQWFDEAGRVTYWNPASEKLFGWKAQDALGKTLDMLIHTPEETAEFLRVLAEIRQSGNPYGPYEAQIHTRDGRTRWALSTTFALPMGDQRLGFVCMDVDITDRKLAEQRVADRTRQLQESESSLKRAQAVAHIGSWHLDLAGSGLSWSEETYRIFAVPGGAPLAYEDFLARVHPEDRDAVNAAWQAAMKGAPYDIVHRIVVDGQIKWVREQAEFIFDDAGQFSAGVGTVQDITAQMLAERQLRSERDFVEGLLNTAPTIVLVLDTQGRIVRLNPYMEEISGYTFAEVQGKDWFNTFLPKSQQAQTKALFLKAINDIQTRGNEDLIVTRDGQERIIEWSDRTLKDAEGRTLGLLAIGQDITERKLTEQELKRSNAELEQFSYAISHDMRQPLRMISSYLQLLEKSLAGQLDGDKQEYFHFAIDGAQRLDQMLVALLDYSRVGRKGEPPQWIASRALLDEALLFLQPAIAEARAEIKISGDWPRVLVSRDEIMRLIQNLIGNAVKYRVAGRIPEITVTSETLGNEWRLCVADNGVGILPDQAHRLFQVFQRLHTRAAYEGTGIGLALCRKIVEHHDGHIDAESAGEGQGSTFRVRLPLKHEGSIGAGDNEKAET